MPPIKRVCPFHFLSLHLIRYRKHPASISNLPLKVERIIGPGRQLLCGNVANRLLEVLIAFQLAADRLALVSWNQKEAAVFKLFSVLLLASCDKWPQGLGQFLDLRIPDIHEAKILQIYFFGKPFHPWWFPNRREMNHIFSIVEAVWDFGWSMLQTEADKKSVRKWS